RNDEQQYGRGGSTQYSVDDDQRGGFGANQWGISESGQGQRFSLGGQFGQFGSQTEQNGPHRGRGPKGYKRTDARVREDINDRLADDSFLDASEIEVEVKNGEVTLSGTVTQRQDKRRAEDLAENVSGVQHVQNNLRLKTQEAGADQETERRSA